MYEWVDATRVKSVLLLFARFVVGSLCRGKGLSRGGDLTHRCMRGMESAPMSASGRVRPAPSGEVGSGPGDASGSRPTRHSTGHGRGGGDQSVFSTRSRGGAEKTKTDFHRRDAETRRNPKAKRLPCGGGASHLPLVLRRPGNTTRKRLPFARLAPRLPSGSEGAEEDRIVSSGFPGASAARTLRYCFDRRSRAAAISLTARSSTRRLASLRGREASSR